jgi:hypothetical protein
LLKKYATVWEKRAVACMFSELCLLALLWTGCKSNSFQQRQREEVPAKFHRNRKNVCKILQNFAVIHRAEKFLNGLLNKEYI